MRAVRIARMARGGLQHAQAHLHPFIGGQSFRNESGQQDIGLPKPFDDFRFHPSSPAYP